MTIGSKNRTVVSLRRGSNKNTQARHSNQQECLSEQLQQMWPRQRPIPNKS